jgi:hypothetical protein
MTSKLEKLLLKQTGESSTISFSNRSTGSKSSTSTNTSSSSSDSDEHSFMRSPVRRSHSRMATIKEVNNTRSPMLSPVSSEHTDVFGESITSIDVWEEEDSFSSLSPMKRSSGRGKSKRRGGSKDRKAKEMHKSVDSLDLHL